VKHIEADDLIGGGLVGLVWWAFLLVIGWISSRLVGFSCNASLGPHGVWFAGFWFCFGGLFFLRESRAPVVG
jgi:hypothetical protein